MSSQLDPNALTRTDMAKARSKTSVDVTDIRTYLYWGARDWESQQRVLRVLSEDPIFDKSLRSRLTRKDRYINGLKMLARIEELAERHGWSSADKEIALLLSDEGSPMNLHTIAFEPVVNSQGSPELLSKYGALIAHRGILGAYLQTELAHGTNVRALETTATYLPKTDEFEIHSPTVSSSKWWIGALGRTATHGVVQAQLILPGQGNMGPHLFLVQLRSLDDHRPLPGRTLGDIGAKALGGMPATDNGFARFDHVRIPRENMLSKFASVTREGKYVTPPHAKLSYGGMLYIRSRMIRDAGWILGRAATVSIRYATVRRQGSKGPDGLERQIITYPSVQYRLFPILAQSYVYILIGRNLISTFDAASKKLAQGDTSPLADMHAITSGLKVLVSTASVQGIEVARRSMGGHGYSDAAGLGKLYASHLPSATYEGDNFVLDQQVVRGSLKALQNVVESQNGSIPALSPVSSYLRLLLSSESTPKVSDTMWSDPHNATSTLVLLLEWRAALVVQDRARHLKEADAGADQRLSKAVTEAFVAGQVGEIIQKIVSGSASEDGVRLGGKSAVVVVDLLRLYLLTLVEGGFSDLLAFGVISAVLSSTPATTRDDPTRALRTAIADLCSHLLPEVIGLTDAFGFTDWQLDSALGVYDGAVYEELWRRAQLEPLNEREVVEGYEEYIKPILERGQRLAARHGGAKL